MVGKADDVSLLVSVWFAALGVAGRRIGWVGLSYQLVSLYSLALGRVRTPAAEVKGAAAARARRVAMENCIVVSGVFACNREICGLKLCLKWRC